jgi:hypothetical protein
MRCRVRRSPDLPQEPEDGDDRIVATQSWQPKHEG